MPLLPHIKERIIKNTNQMLNLSNAGIWDEHICELVELVNANPAVTSLNLADNNISTAGATELVSLKYIKNLDVSRNNFDDDSAIILIKAPEFTGLDLSRNFGITDKTGQYILDQNVQHTTLSIRQTGISSKLYNKISEKIACNRNNYAAACRKVTETSELSIQPPEQNAGNGKKPPSPVGLFSQTTQKTNVSSSPFLFSCFKKSNS